MTKWLALIFMIIDHIGFVFQSSLSPDVYIYMRLLGRLSFPLFVYYVVLGTNRTSNKKRYLFRMVVLAAISQIIINSTFNTGIINVLFSFSLMIIYSMIYKKQWGKYAVILLFIISFVTEYSYSGFLIFMALNYIHNTEISNKSIWAALSIFIAFLPPVIFGDMIPLQLFAALSGFAMFAPQLEKRVLPKKIENMVFYIYYPIQWIIFYIIVNL